MIGRPIILATVAMIALAATAHAFDPITWYSFDGGGVAFATAGTWRLGGTIGQPDAGQLAGGAFTLRGGFWKGGTPPSVGVGDGPGRVLAFRFDPPMPNPVRARSRLAFDLPRASRVALSIFDVSGRAVRRWDLGLLPPGHQERMWSVADGGRPLSSGVYFLRLDAGRDRGTHKVLVLH